MIYLESMGQAIAPTMDELRRVIHRGMAPGRGQATLIPIKEGKREKGLSKRQRKRIILTKDKNDLQSERKILPCMLPQPKRA